MVDKALEIGIASVITDVTALRIVEAETYPHFLHVMALLFLLNAGIALLIGYFKPRKEPFELKYTEQVSIEPYIYLNRLVLLFALL